MQDTRFSNRTSEGKIYATLGAGPERSNPFSLGRLIAGVNREQDVILSHNTSSSSIVNFICLSDEAENRLIASLFAAHSSYGNNLNYAFFPSAGSNTYNSNSYISGLLGAVGYSMPQPNSTPGFEIPIPRSEFKF